MTTTAARMQPPPMYVQCDHCQTVYRITTEQLSAARGQVRCGECNQVFDALNSLSDRPPAPRPVSPPAETPAAAPGPGSAPTEALTASSQTDTVTAPPPTAAQHAPPVAAATPPDRSAALFHIRGSASVAYTPLVLGPRHGQPAQFGAALSATAPPSFVRDVAVTEPSITTEARPVATSTQAAGGQWLKTTSWSLLNLLLIVTLLGQYAYFNREELAQYGELRPVLAKLCSTLGCTLPLQRDLSRIAIANRSVHSHPQRPNALLINTTLVNEAPHAQPYPLLELVFSNLSGEAVAGRQFRPDDYLPPETDIAAGMPPRRPVTFAVEILDPGKEAINFQFELR